MTDILRHSMAVLVGFCSGAIISGAVFAFITVIGVVERMAQKTKTRRYVKWYETAIMVGGVFGVVGGMFDFNIPLGLFVFPIIGVCAGIFIGVLVMSLAEVLNVIPILTRRVHLQKGMFWFILAVAGGKMIGALIYTLNPGFYSLGE